MDPTELCYLSAVELAAGYRTKRFSPTEVTEAILERIQSLNPILNAYCTVTAETALQEARGAEAAMQRGGLQGLLHGIPVSIKDLIYTKGIRTTSGSKLSSDFVPDVDAAVVERLRSAGAVILGKTNTSEFGWKSSADNPLFGPTRNPWNLDRTTAGSSGGAAAAVAAGMGPLALGTDGGGSVRQPASFCGVFGLRGSFGLVSTWQPGTLNDVNVVGPLSRTVRDAALLLVAIAGPDSRDLYSLEIPQPDYLAACDGGLRGLRVAWTPDLGYGPVDPEVRSVTEKAAKRFVELGCELEGANPGWEDPAEVFHALRWPHLGAMIDGLEREKQDLLDPGLKELVAASRSMTAFDVARATRVRARLVESSQRFFERYDLLLTPTMAVPPFAHGIDIPPEIAGRHVTGMQWTPFTFPFSLTWQPAASIPCGWTSDGLPIGLQLVGRRREDALVLRASAAFEMIAPWAHRRPELPA